MAYQSSKKRWVANDRQCCLLLLPVVNRRSDDRMEYYGVLLLWPMLYPRKPTWNQRIMITNLWFHVGNMPKYMGTRHLLIAHWCPFQLSSEPFIQSVAVASLWFQLCITGPFCDGKNGGKPFCSFESVARYPNKNMRLNLGVKLGCSGLCWLTTRSATKHPGTFRSLLINVASIILLIAVCNWAPDPWPPKRFLEETGNTQRMQRCQSETNTHDMTVFLQHDPPGAICRPLKLWETSSVKGAVKCIQKMSCRTKRMVNSCYKTDKNLTTSRPKKNPSLSRCSDCFSQGKTGHFHQSTAPIDDGPSFPIQRASVWCTWDLASDPVLSLRELQTPNKNLPKNMPAYANLWNNINPFLLGLWVGVHSVFPWHFGLQIRVVAGFETHSE